MRIEKQEIKLFVMIMLYILCFDFSGTNMSWRDYDFEGMDANPNSPLLPPLGDDVDIAGKPFL